MLTLDEVKDQAMALTESERARLATDLLISLPPVLEDEDDGLQEAMRRDAEMDADPSVCMTWSELAASVGR